MGVGMVAQPCGCGVGIAFERLGQRVRSMERGQLTAAVGGRAHVLKPDLLTVGRIEERGHGRIVAGAGLGDAAAIALGLREHVRRCHAPPLRLDDADHLSAVDQCIVGWAVGCGILSDGAPRQPVERSALGIGPAAHAPAGGREPSIDPKLAGQPFRFHGLAGIVQPAIGGIQQACSTVWFPGASLASPLPPRPQAARVLLGRGGRSCPAGTGCPPPAPGSVGLDACRGPPHPERGSAP